MIAYIAQDLRQQAVIFQPVTGTIQVIFTAQAKANAILMADKVEVSEVRWIEHGEIDLNPYACEALEAINMKRSYVVSDLGR